MSSLPPPASSSITHVSDTALMVAACRALETEATDGFVRDPFAARLAGERGRAILEQLPSREWMRFGVGVRSRLMDELITEALSDGRIAAVVSVGCGLDSRPWRLALRPELRWIEADFAEMLDYKEAVMAGETPNCRRARLAADVTDVEQRHALYAMSGNEPALLITEGLLMYLPSATVEAMATEAGDGNSITDWLCDVTTSAFANALKLDTSRTVRHVQAQDSLAGEDILATLHRAGWNTASWRSYIKDAGFARERGQRLMGNRPQPEGPPPEVMNDPTGVHRLTRA